MVLSPSRDNFAFSQLPLRNRRRMYFVRPIGQSKRPNIRPGAGQKGILRDSRAPVCLNCSIQHAKGHVRRHNFDHCDFGTRRFIPGRVHHVRGLQREQPGLFDLHARVGNVGADGSLFG